MPVMLLPAPTTPVHPSLTLPPRTSYACGVCTCSSPRGLTSATAFCTASVVTFFIIFNSFWTLRQGLFWKSQGTNTSLVLYGTSYTGSLLCNESTSRFAFSCATVWRGLVQCAYPSFAIWWALRLESVIPVLLPDRFWSSLDTIWSVMVVEASQLRGRVCEIYFPWMFEITRSDWTFSKRGWKLFLCSSNKQRFWGFKAPEALYKCSILLLLLLLLLSWLQTKQQFHIILHTLP